MAMDRFQFVVQDDEGNIIDGAQVEVRKRMPSGGTPLANVYSDYAGTVPLGNPFPVADGRDGYFHAAGGYYRVRAYKAGFERIWPYVAVGTAKATDFGAFLVPSGVWDAVTTFSSSAVVRHGAYLFLSLVADNLNHEPDASTPGDTACWMWIPQPAVGEHVEISAFLGDSLGDGETAMRYEFAAAASFAADLEESVASAADTSSGTAILSLRKNGVEFGTLTFGAADPDGVFVAASGANFVAGDLLSIVGPDPADATLANIAITLRGARDSGLTEPQESGLAVIDFGAHPGAATASVVVTGLSDLAADAVVQAFLYPGAGTSDHSADEHLVSSMQLTVTDIVAGTGFTIHAMATARSGAEGSRLYGQFNLGWLLK